MPSLDSILRAWAHERSEGVESSVTVDSVQALAELLGGTDKAAARLHVSRREVQRKIAQERALAGEERAQKLSKESRRGTTPAQQVLIRQIGEEAGRPRTELAAAIRGRGLHLDSFSGLICISDDCRNRTIAPVGGIDIPAEGLQEFAAALESGDREAMAEYFGEALGLAITGGSSGAYFPGDVEGISFELA